MWRLIGAIHRKLNWFLEQLVSLAVAALVLDVLWGVFTRLVMSAPSRWTEEVATFLLIWVAMLGAAVAFNRGQHLGLDYFVKKLEPSAQLFLAVAVQLLVILFVSIALVYGGYVLVSETLAAGQVTPAVGIKMGYVYLAVPVSGLFMIAFAVERIVELVGSAPDRAAEDNAAVESNSLSR